MIHFNCPNCGARLDVDSGFRGAVARCEHCGALINVPPKESRAAPAQRPARPGEPATRTRVPGAPDDRARRRFPAWAWVLLAALAAGGGAALWLLL